ncbi:hypothetical protein F4805DRAFT_446600, partial [Annulohypoxylon moriforme]
MSAPVFEVNDSLFEQDPKLIIQSIVAYPDRYFTPGFDVAVRDGMRQVAFRQNLASTGPFPIPLLIAAIESEDTEEWLLHRFMEGLENAFPDAVNGVYPIIQTLEPPLHTAVRVGRADAVRTLLSSPNSNPATRYTQEHSTLTGDCRLSGSAHPDPCDPNLFQSPCLAASEYAIECFSRAEAGSQLQKNIESAALIFVAAGKFPAPLNDDCHVVPSFKTALKSGMNKYVSAALNRILNAPPSDTHRRRLFERGLERILYQAAKAMESSPIVREILDLSTKYNIFPIPPNPASLGVNPIASALKQTHADNACMISNFI